MSAAPSSLSSATASIDAATGHSAGGAALHRIDRTLGAVIDGAGAIAAFSGLALVLVVGGNVLLRYVFNSGSIALQEMEWHLVSPIALFGMAYGLRHGAHVRVDFLYDRMGPRLRSFIDVIAAVLMGAVAVVIVMVAIPYVQGSYSMAEGSPDPGGLPWRWVLKAFIPLGFGLLILQSLAHIGVALRGLRRPDIEASHNPEAASAS
jgi:TRAP-type mannitol/chloroaromatic compound transport system permease small subunit